MDDDVFNMSVRKFLKKVGITSQRDIERAVQDAIANGRLKGTEKLAVQTTVVIGDIDLTVAIDGEIELA